MSNAFWGGALLGWGLMGRWQERRRRRKQAAAAQQAAGLTTVLPAGWARCAGCGTPSPLQQLQPLEEGSPWFCAACVRRQP